MNSTNRGLNRLFILIVGLLLLAAGAGAVALATVPVVASTWRRVAGQLAGGAQPWVGQPVTGTASALVIGIAVIAVVLVLLLIAFIVKQGHGHTAAALYARSGSSTTRIDLSIPKALLQEHLQHRDELTAVQISAYEVRHTPMLKITARCRRGVSRPSSHSSSERRSATSSRSSAATFRRSSSSPEDSARSPPRDLGSPRAAAGLRPARPCRSSARGGDSACPARRLST